MKSKIVLLNAFKPINEKDASLWKKYYDYLVKYKRNFGNTKMLNMLNISERGIHNFHERILIKTVAKSNIHDKT